MDRLKFGLKVFQSQDERDDSEVNHGDLLISQSIVNSESSSDVINSLYYWMDEIEKAIHCIEEMEEINKGCFNFKN